MKKTSITVGGKRYQMKFGYGCLREICRKYGFQKTSGFDKLIKKLKLDKIEDPTFEQLDFIGNLVVAAIENENSEAVVCADDVMDVLLCDPKMITTIFDQFQNSLPQIDQVNPSKRGK